MPTSTVVGDRASERLVTRENDRPESRRSRPDHARTKGGGARVALPLHSVARSDRGAIPEKPVETEIPKVVAVPETAGLASLRAVRAAAETRVAISEFRIPMMDSRTVFDPTGQAFPVPPQCARAQGPGASR